MKKVLVLALGMLLIPFTAFGMQAMSDSDLESITGQSGVAISLENVQVYSHTTGEEIWFETSGNAVGIVYEDEFETYSYIYVTTLDFESGNPENPKLLDVGDGLARGDYSGLEVMNPDQYDMPQDPRVLTIRVVNSGEIENDRMFFESENAYVEIGLPTLEIFSLEGARDIMSIYVIHNDDESPLDATLDPNQRIGRIHTTDANTTTAIFGGRVGITSYGNVDYANKNQPFNEDHH